jgi:hypothetical protein
MIFLYEKKYYRGNKIDDLIDFESINDKMYLNRYERVFFNDTKIGQKKSINR